jgi:DNA-binding Lrp family transcriptional regulator
MEYRSFRLLEGMRVTAVQAYILFKVNSGMEKEVSKQLAELDEVQEASITYGEYDVIAKINVNDLHLLEDFLADKIRSVRSVVLTSTMIIAQEYKGRNQRTLK